MALFELHWRELCRSATSGRKCKRYENDGSAPCRFSDLNMTGSGALFGSYSQSFRNRTFLARDQLERELNARKECDTNALRLFFTCLTAEELEDARREHDIDCKAAERVA